MRACGRSTLAILEVRRLVAGYGRAQVLFEIDLAVERGEIVALLGRNGAGKSTTLKAIMGLIPVLSGDVVFDGHNLKSREPHEIARLGLGYVPEDRRIFTDLTVAENLEVGRRPARGGASVWTDERLFALFPALAPLRNRRGARMSGGEQQMLCIARTLAGNPTAILLDEPSEGLAPVVVEQVAKAILALKSAGVTVLLAEQSQHFTQRVADRAYRLEKGIIASA
jgi:branched-chain amino acid transport system ATP-binding protein